MPEPDAERIRLSLPADADLRTVVEVAVAVVARRLGLPDGEVKAARNAVGDAFVELADTGDSQPIELDLTLEARRMVARLRTGEAERTVTAPASADATG